MLNLILNFIYSKRKLVINHLFVASIILMLVIRIMFVFSTTLGLQNGEEDNLWNILNVANGRSLYLSPTAAPYEIFLYAPLSQLIQVFLVKLFCIKNIYYLSVFLRFFSLVINLLTSFFIYAYIKNLINDKFRSLMLALVSLVSIIHLNWTIRVDSLSILISVYSIIYLLKHYENINVFKCLFVGFLMTLSVYTKQDGIQLIIIVPIALIFTNKIKQGILILLFSLTFSLLIYFLLFLVYDQNFYNSVVGGLKNPYSIINAVNVLNRYFQLYTIYPFCILLIIVWGIFKRENDKIYFLSLILLGIFMFAILSSFKLGSWVNYFSLFNLVGILIVGEFLKFKKVNLYFELISLIFIFQFMSNIVFNYLWNEFKFDKRLIYDKRDISLEIEKIVPKNYLIYTNDDILELYFYKRTIFPNQVFYNSMSTFKYRVKDDLKSKLVVLTSHKENDFVINNILKHNNSKLKKIAQVKDYELFVLVK